MTVLWAAFGLIRKLCDNNRNSIQGLIIQINCMPFVFYIKVNKKNMIDL